MVAVEGDEPFDEIDAVKKGDTTTFVLTTYDTAGVYSLTMVIFKGKHLRRESLYGCPVNVAAKLSDNSWIIVELLVE